MKILRVLSVCILFISLFGCEKDESEDVNNAIVDNYVELLKTGKCTTGFPDFTFENIPRLLEYRNETQIISGFPYNLISSYNMSECSLGMYVLWTIESIRTGSIESKYAIAKFPSQNPILQFREEPYYWDDGIEAQNIASNAYYDWWEENKHKEFSEFRNIDPLLETIYFWH